MHLPSQYQEFIHLSRYARWDENLKRRETWKETVKRYIDFFMNRYTKDGYIDFLSTFTKLEEAIVNLEVMPSMRCLMTAGKALDRDNIAGFNCSYLTISRIRSFDELMYILLCGTGVGFSVERQYVNQLPEVAEDFYDTDTTIQVRDSKLGWANAFRELISMLYVGRVPKWDVSKVRPAGSRLKTFGGRASGPEPLVDLFEFSINMFKNSAGRKLTSIECHDLVCKIADIVVVGGVRRSALISLSNLSDERMRMAKSGQWWIENPQRALANNSVCYTEKPDIEIFMKEWLSLIESKSGERGIFNRVAAQKKYEVPEGMEYSYLDVCRRDENHDFGTNPCCLVGDTIIKTDKGDLSIKEIVDNGFEQHKVLAYDNDEIVFVDIEAGQLTRPNAELLEIEIEDDEGNVHTIQLTPDHRIYTENRGYIKAEDLTEEDIFVINSEL